ncbi:MAG: type II 3-dehydroquinate dehydratase [Tissierellia bacterium]|nr:type II 3-dehydroquinate dehydratase [Tissierellia bacterium]
MMNILIIHGPNLDILGKRDKNIYGKLNLEEINYIIENKAKEENINVIIFQSNFEGEIIEKIHDAMDNNIDGIIINPAAFTHYSIAIRDAIEAITIPVIEVHLSNIYSRETFRNKSVIAPVCTGQITGFGHNSYLLALNMLKLMINS